MVPPLLQNLPSYSGIPFRRSFVKRFPETFPARHIQNSPDPGLKNRKITPGPVPNSAEKGYHESMKTFLVNFFNKRTWAADFLVTFAILIAASLVCFLFMRIAEADTHVPLIFVLAVLCVSRFTHGYLYGIVSSIVAVFGVNFAFTYPYFKLDFSLTGYPLTFLVMLTVAVIVSTLTTQIKAQEQMRLDMDREKMRSNLLRSISHDIRTPLTSIAGSASAILENEDQLSAPEKKALMEDIRSEAELLNQSVENILSITRVSDPALKLPKSPELPEEIIENVVKNFRKRHPGIRVSVNLPTEPLLVPMDPILIGQVFSNLLENAVQHGETTDEVIISVNQKGKRAVFSVEDNGRGIPSPLLSHLFDGTLPLNRNRSDCGRNMRIGLSVCKTIIDAHQGTLTAENKTEGGAAFRFTLPLEEQADGN